MNICIPILKDEGLKSEVSSHFGQAPLFMLVDTDTESCRAIPSKNDHQSHGACMPLQSFEGEKLDGLVVGGIGQGAIMKFAEAGIAVFFSQQTTVEKILTDYKAGTLKPVTPQMACGGHKQGGGGCSHD